MCAAISLVTTAVARGHFLAVPIPAPCGALNHPPLGLGVWIGAAVVWPFFYHAVCVLAAVVP